MTFLALIPARGGSKRISQKNIKSFAGKPIIGWTIEKAIKTNLFKKILVSTDDKEIAKVSKSFGADIAFPRPNNISNDRSTVLEVVRHSIEELEKSGALFSALSRIHSETYGRLPAAGRGRALAVRQKRLQM